MAHRGLHGHEFEQTPGDTEAQGSLACRSPWGHKEWNTSEWLNNNYRHCNGYKMKKMISALTIHCSGEETKIHTKSPTLWKGGRTLMAVKQQEQGKQRFPEQAEVLHSPSPAQHAATVGWIPCSTSSSHCEHFSRGKGCVHYSWVTWLQCSLHLLVARPVSIHRPILLSGHCSSRAIRMSYNPIPLRKPRVHQDSELNTAYFLGLKNELVTQFGTRSQRKFAEGFYETILLILRKWLKLFFLILDIGSHCGPCGTEIWSLEPRSLSATEARTTHSRQQNTQMISKTELASQPVHVWRPPHLCNFQYHKPIHPPLKFKLELGFLLLAKQNIPNIIIYSKYAKS